MANDPPHESKTSPPHGNFVTTRWSRVVLAGDADHPEAHAALSSLCQDYWRPLYYFARRKRHAPEDAQDLTQGFIMGLLESGSLAKADPERGRFRTFLLGAFCHYLANRQRDDEALKRGGGVTVLSFSEDVEAEFLEQPAEVMTPELLYDRAWALALLERVMTRLREEYAKADRHLLFEAIEPFLTGGDSRPGYARLGEPLGMSESAVTVAVHRMRRRYGELLRAEVSETVATPDAVEDELRHLIRIVSMSPETP